MICGSAHHLRCFDLWFPNLVGIPDKPNAKGKSIKFSESLDIFRDL